MSLKLPRKKGKVVLCQQYIQETSQKLANVIDTVTCLQLFAIGDVSLFKECLK